MNTYVIRYAGGAWHQHYAIVRAESESDAIDKLRSELNTIGITLLIDTDDFSVACIDLTHDVVIIAAEGD